MINVKTFVCAAALGLALMGQSYANTNTPMLGGTGGGKFKDLCSGGAYLIGFKFWSGKALDSVKPICRRVDDDGEWTGTRRYEQRWGGNGGTPGTVTCDRNQYVTSLHVRWDFNGIVHSFDLNCHSFDRSDRSTDSTDTSGGVPFDDAGTSCPKGEFAVGVRGRHGSLVDAIGLVCGDKPD